MKLSGKFFLKHPFLFVLLILAYIYAIICYPLVYLKRKVLGLNSYKTAIFKILNKFYNSEINENDYLFDNSILPGSKIQKRDNNLSLFGSFIKSDQGTCFQILVDNHRDDLGLPNSPDIQKSLQRLSKLFEIDQFLNIYFENHKISRLTLRLVLTAPEKSARFSNLLNSTFILQIELNPDLDIIKIQKFVNNNNDISAMLKNAKMYENMSFDDISLILYLENLKDSEYIHALLPEIIIPSAYDFASDDFKNRLLLFEMIEY